MASTKKILAKYSSKLDPMAQYAGSFLKRETDREILERSYRGIADFCHNNTNDFLSAFLGKARLEALPQITLSNELDSTLLKDFCRQLIRMEGECVFLLKDTQEILEQYQQGKGQGFGVKVNRGFLGDTAPEEDYFTLINLVYTTLETSNDLGQFLEQYQVGFKGLLEQSDHFVNRAQEISNYVSSHVLKDPVIFVDLGFQFTFSLFCQAALREYAKDLKVDFYSLSAYPWLHSMFSEKYFSEKNEAVLLLEIKSIELYKKRMTERASAALVGFAIGDSLGFPVAGIDASDVRRFSPDGVQGFSKNLKHPYFSHLEPGKYTDNTSMLMMSAEHLIETGGFDINAYAEKFTDWFQDLKNNVFRERWLGPTATTALENLLASHDPQKSGSLTTQSCSAIYRIIPLGVYYRSFQGLSQDDFVKTVMASAGMTHNSDISKTGAVIAASIVGDLVNGVLPETAVRSACSVIKKTDDNTLLLDNIKTAIDAVGEKSVEWARKEFGTGSPVYQMLPLAIFIFLTYSDDFTKAVLAGANSYRNDTLEEQERLKNLSWEEQLLEIKGGNTDGVAGLIGAFVGAHVGLNQIPEEFRLVEDGEKIADLGRKLV